MPFPSPLRPFLLSASLALAVAAGAHGAVAAQAPPGEPRVPDMDVQPVLRNVDDMAHALDRLYPQELKEAGIQGVVSVWIYIDELGRVRDARLKESSGYLAFDEAADKVVRLMSFEPARKGNAAIPVWIPMSINFRSQSGPGEAATGSGAPTT
jgi:protein TonB